MKKITGRLVTGVTLLTLFTLLTSHEFWLDPVKFKYRVGEEINIRFLVGEDFKGENWSGNRAKIKDLRLYRDTGMRNIDYLLSDQQGDSLRFPLMDEGTAMITFNSTNSFIRLDSLAFTNYLKEDGLTSALNYRADHGETDSAGREFYQRSVKTIVQVGFRYTNVCARATDLPLDLVPAQNPLLMRDGDSLTVKVLFHHKPLAGQVVQVWHRNKEIYLHVQYKSNAKGEIRFPVMKKKRWMVSTVQMERLTDRSQADWQSYWGSLTWGYE